MKIDRSIFDDYSDAFYKAYDPLDREGNRREYVVSLQQKEIPFVRPSAFVKPKRRPNGKDRKRHRVRGIVFVRDGFACVECGKKFEAPEGKYDGSIGVQGLTLGHVIPASQGGEISVQNIRAQCFKCNGRMEDNVWVSELGRY